MFIIPTYVKESKINGLGVFTSVPIKKGELVWVFDPTFDRVFTVDQVKQFPTPVQEYIFTRGFLNKQGDTYFLGIDHDSFANHSDTPNIIQDLSSPTEYTAPMMAARDIEAHEEILPNYNEYVAQSHIDYIFRNT